MKSSALSPIVVGPAQEAGNRLDYLDATRAFALLLGIVFHACLSFLPVFMGWAVQDVSTSPVVGMFMVVSHAFRMETFFLLAGFFGHLTFHRKGAGDFVRSRVIRIVVPFVVGWFILRPLLISGWIMGNASLRGDVNVWAGLLGGIQSLDAASRNLHRHAPLVSVLPGDDHRADADGATIVGCHRTVGCGITPMWGRPRRVAGGVSVFAGDPRDTDGSRALVHEYLGHGHTRQVAAPAPPGARHLRGLLRPRMDVLAGNAS